MTEATPLTDALCDRLGQLSFERLADVKTSLVPILQHAQSLERDRARLIEALKSSLEDKDALFDAAKTGKPVLVEIGFFRRHHTARALLAELEQKEAV